MMSIEDIILHTYLSTQGKRDVLSANKNTYMCLLYQMLEPRGVKIPHPHPKRIEVRSFHPKFFANGDYSLHLPLTPLFLLPYFRACFSIHVI